MKARLFINRSMDPDREFEEQAFWACAAMELLGKAALVRISPLLIAHPEEDGAKSLLLASEVIDYNGEFSSIQAKAIWARCARAFRSFDGNEAKKIAAGRNEYLHSTGAGFDAIPQAQWWPRYWGLTFVLIEHLDLTIEDFVGRERALQVEAYLKSYGAYVAAQLATRIERAQSLLARHRAGSLSARLEAEWGTFVPLMASYMTTVTCPSCDGDGQLGGEDILETTVKTIFIAPEPWMDDEVEVTHEIDPDEFSCPTCHLWLDSPALLAEAGFDDTFTVEGSPEDYYDQLEYNNE